MNQKFRKNEKIWDELARKGVLCSQPKLEMTVHDAKEYINKNGFYEDSLKGKNVLCLACGGGQQGIAFALLGAEVTVVDFSQVQLDKEVLAAEAYNKKIRMVKADMRDLSFSANDAFDIVYQPYSINYIPSIEEVFNEVSRVTKPNGYYDIMFHNPFVHGSWKDGCWGSAWKAEELWEGIGYPIWQPYQDGFPVKTVDPNWNFENPDGEPIKVSSPQEYRHTLATIINGLIRRGFEILKLGEEKGSDDDNLPGTWEHYKSCAPPWLYLLSKKTSSLDKL